MSNFNLPPRKPLPSLPAHLSNIQTDHSRIEVNSYKEACQSLHSQLEDSLNKIDEYERTIQILNKKIELFESESSEIFQNRQHSNILLKDLKNQLQAKNRLISKLNEEFQQGFASELKLMKQEKSELNLKISTMTVESTHLLSRITDLQLALASKNSLLNKILNINEDLGSDSDDDENTQRYKNLIKKQKEQIECLRSESSEAWNQMMDKDQEISDLSMALNARNEAIRQLNNREVEYINIESLAPILRDPMAHNEQSVEVFFDEEKEEDPFEEKITSFKESLTAADDLLASGKYRGVILICNRVLEDLSELNMSTDQVYILLMKLLKNSDEDINIINNLRSNTFISLGKTYQKLGEIGKARRCYERSLRISDKYTSERLLVMNSSLYCLKLLKDHEAALNLFNELELEHSNYADSSSIDRKYALACVLAAKGNANFTIAVSTFPEDQDKLNLALNFFVRSREIFDDIYNDSSYEFRNEYCELLQGIGNISKVQEMEVMAVECYEASAKVIQPDSKYPPSTPIMESNTNYTPKALSNSTIKGFKKSPKSSKKYPKSPIKPKNMKKPKLKLEKNIPVQSSSDNLHSQNKPLISSSHDDYNRSSQSKTVSDQNPETHHQLTNSYFSHPLQQMSSSNQNLSVLPNQTNSPESTPKSRIDTNSNYENNNKGHPTRSLPQPPSKPLPSIPVKSFNQIDSLQSISTNSSRKRESNLPDHYPGGTQYDPIHIFTPSPIYSSTNEQLIVPQNTSTVAHVKKKPYTLPSVMSSSKKLQKKRISFSESDNTILYHSLERE